MAWEKLGHVYVARGERPWAQSRAYLPTSLDVHERRIRVYVAFLDDDMAGRIGYVDVDATDPTRVLEVSGEPVLDLGQPGMFDDSGVNPLTVFRHEGRVWLYYLGWQRMERVPYLLFTGLAQSDDDGATFRRHSLVPVLDRSDAEPQMRSAACVLPGRDRFRAWYVVGQGWVESRGKARPTYGVRHVESPDGLTWPAEGTPCLDPVPPDEYGFGRPFVVDRGDGLEMWFSVRTHSLGYRLGYAESADGLSWERNDAAAGLDVSAEGWDSEMVHCSCVHRTPHGTYLFYNGNGYGETGFGVAVRRED